MKEKEPDLYHTLGIEDFDALVTGELAHYAIWMEDELIQLISRFFCKTKVKADFQRLLLRREGLTFQDKIEIVRAMMPLFKNQVAANGLKPILARVETFKAKRNALAHGLAGPDSSEANKPPGVCLNVTVVNRAGKEKTITITPESHASFMDETHELFEDLRRSCKAVGLEPSTNTSSK